MMTCPVEIAAILCLWCLLLGSVAGGWTTHHDGYEAHRKNIRQNVRWTSVATLVTLILYTLPRIWPVT